MKHYNVLSDYEKQKKLQEIDEEYGRIKRDKYWVLKRMGIPRSTYYDWLKTGGVTKSRFPKTVGNKTPKTIENIILKMRDDIGIYRSEGSFLDITDKLNCNEIMITKNGVWSVLR